MNIRILLISSIYLTFLSIFPVYAQDVQLLDVTINEAKGDVEIMLPNTFDWVPVPEEAGVTFSEGTQIRTGPRSSVSLVFADSGVVLVDSLTYMTVEHDLMAIMYRLEQYIKAEEAEKKQKEKNKKEKEKEKENKKQERLTTEGTHS